MRRCVTRTAGSAGGRRPAPFAAHRRARLLSAAFVPAAAGRIQDTPSGAAER